MAKIKRDLPNNQYQAAINANAPTGANPFLTALDLPVVTGDANRLVFDVKIDQTGGILKGQAVYVSGADGTNILVTKADYTVEATSATTLGLLTLSGNNNALRQVVAEGILKGTGAAPLDTSAASPGDPIWLGNDGNLIYGTINEPYAPNQLVFIGVVVEANPVVGEIFVKIQNGFELGELHDVDVKSTLPVDGEVLTYDVSTGLWHNEALPALFGASITPNLEPVIENTITDPSTVFPEFGDSYLVPIGAIGVWIGQDNNIATWDGTSWVYYTPVLNDITTVLTGTNAGNVYLFDGLNWILYASTSTAATPFYLAGSGVDAGGNKLATIARAGKVVIGQNNGPLYATAALSVRGNLVSENLFTRAFFCSTFNVAFVNTWFRVAWISINNTRSGTYKILFSEYNKTTTNQAFSAVIDISATKAGGGGSISAKVTVISHSEGYTLTEDNFKIYRNQAPAFGPLTIGIYYRPTQPGAQSNFTLLNSLDTQGFAQIKWYNTNLGATITDSIFDLTNRANIIEYAVKNNFKAIVDPTINDDLSLNYWIGSVWVNTITKKSYVCTDSTAGGAIWTETTNTAFPTLYNQQIQDEGVSLTQRNIIDFVGAGVSAADSGGKTVVTITGGGTGGTLKTIQVGPTDMSGPGSIGILANQLLYIIQPTGGAALYNNRAQGVVPADFASGLKLNLRTYRPGTGPTTSLTIYINGVATNIVAQPFSPATNATYQLFSFTVTTPIVAGDTLSILAQLTAAAGQDFYFRDIYFTYQS